MSCLLDEIVLHSCFNFHLQHPSRWKSSIWLGLFYCRWTLQTSLAIKIITGYMARVNSLPSHLNEQQISAILPVKMKQTRMSLKCVIWMENFWILGGACGLCALIMWEIWCVLGEILHSPLMIEKLFDCFNSLCFNFIYGSLWRLLYFDMQCQISLLFWWPVVVCTIFYNTCGQMLWRNLLSCLEKHECRIVSSD